MRRNRTPLHRRPGRANGIGLFGRKIDAERARELGDAARRLAREREEAAVAVEELFSSTPPAEWNGLAERDVLRTCGAIEKLGHMVCDAIRTGDPSRALALAAVAVSCAEATSAYPAPITAQLRGHAWNDYARALLSVHRPIEALQATDEACARLEGFGALAHDRAIVGLVRAETLQRIGRDHDALALLASVERVFLQHGDTRRAGMASRLEEEIRIQRF